MSTKGTTQGARKNACAVRHLLIGVLASVQAGPIVGEEDGVAGIGGVVLDAGGLAGGYAAEVLGFFEAGDILRGLVGDAGDRVGVVEQLLRAVGKCGRGGAFLK